MSRPLGAVVLAGVLAITTLRCSSGRLSEVGAAPDPAEPGRSPTASGSPGGMRLHRLNRSEYNNTVRDLLQTALTPADSFPPDDISHGFDNIGDALNTSPAALGLYAQSAAALAQEAMQPSSAAYASLHACPQGLKQADACAESIMQTFAEKAWRRPLADDEVAALSDLTRQLRAGGMAFDDSLAAGIEAILLSHNFIFRIESKPATAAGTARLGPYELASRLSYFLWSTTPDAPLLAAAKSGALSSDAGLKAQFDRMVADPRAAEFVANFAGQWLRLRDVATVTPDSALFAAYTPALGQAMVAETQAFMADAIARDQPVATLLTAPYTFANGALAKHYGLPATSGGNAMAQINFPSGSPRQGLLTQGAVLAVTSHPDGGSPVLRGRFILTQMLCAPPPNPPADVPSLPTPAAKDTPQTMRQRLEQHVADPGCAGCHLIIDPPGWAMEGFDAIGRARTKDHGLPIDTTGTMKDGTAFSDIRDLSTKLSQRDAFAACVTEFLYVYALGRSLQDSDVAALEALNATLSQTGHPMRQILAGIVMSENFRSYSPDSTGS